MQNEKDPGEGSYYQACKTTQNCSETCLSGWAALLLLLAASSSKHSLGRKVPDRRSKRGADQFSRLVEFQLVLRSIHGIQTIQFVHLIFFSLSFFSHFLLIVVHDHGKSQSVQSLINATKIIIAGSRGLNVDNFWNGHFRVQ
jgi:hypothetical protein